MLYLHNEDLPDIEVDPPLRLEELLRRRHALAFDPPAAGPPLDCVLNIIGTGLGCLPSSSGSYKAQALTCKLHVQMFTLHSLHVTM